MAQLISYAMDLVYSLTNCVFCFPNSPNLKVNNRSFKLLRLLGEGGFSYVYLVQDANGGQLFALKKIRCPFGQESVALALRECEAYALFAPHPNIIHSIDYQVADARDKSDPGSKTVYILLPYYRRGNLQDAINANLVNRTRFPEKRLVVLFLGLARALKAMHQYRVRGGPGGPGGQQRAKQVRRDAANADADAARQAGDEVEEEEQGLIADSIADTQEGVGTGELRAYAHRDLKPGNVMIDDDGKSPVLMDLGSLAPSPTAITSRALALEVQDTAAEHSTMPYRAPELFDVKTGTTVDTKVDVWSFGCTLYTCLVGKSPFEARSEETGGSLSICVLSGDWRFPDEAGSTGRKDAGTAVPDADKISDPVKDLVRRCLQVEPADRPDVDQLIELLETVIQTLPEDPDDGAFAE